jgi:hypothetical protein
MRSSAVLEGDPLRRGAARERLEVAPDLAIAIG